MSTFRWRIAEALDQSPRTCWVDLVDWASDDGLGAMLREEGEPGILLRDSTESCKADAERTGTCYCGKFRSRKTNESAKAGPTGLNPAPERFVTDAGPDLADWGKGGL